MIVHVRASGYLQRKMPGRRTDHQVSLPRGKTVLDVIEAMEIPPNQVWVVRVNGEHVEKTHPLRDGDRVELFPLVGGG